MATVTKPIALDESLNTTELSSRNVADVLAQELSAVATAIGGIAVPSADHVSYDNSVSGLSATDVQNALDEIVSDIPTVNNGTLTIQQNGTSIGSFSANTASNVTANIKTPTADKKTATSEFSTADGGLLSKCQINLVPVQDLHGYDNPWVGGGGKNKYDTGFYSATATNRGIKYVADAEGIITTNGTAATENSYLNMNNVVLPEGNYIVTGCPANGSPTTYQVSVYNATSSTTVAADLGSGATFTADGTSEYRLFIRIYAGYTVNNLVFKPMLRLSTETDPTFAPYSNICPISGHTEVDLEVKDGDNVTQHTYQVQIGSTVYGGYVDLVSGVMTVTHAYKDLGDYTWTKHPTDSGRFYTHSSQTDYIKPTSNTDEVGNIICSQYKAYSQSNLVNNHKNGGISIDASPQPYINIIDTNYASATANEFKTAMNGVDLVYELATPTTIQLTPQQIETLAGQNNLSTPLSGQSIETNGVEYKELFTFADVKEYVDKKIPDAPTTDGTYTLQAVVSGGVPTYSWV